MTVPRRPADSDETVRLKPPPRRSPIAALAALGMMILLASICGVVWFASRPAPFQLAGEAQIFHHISDQLTVFRFRPDRLILVVDCPGLHQQGEMFDRVAALIEKADTPRDRVLTAVEFRAVLRATHETVGTYYYGNDYPARALRRFFRLSQDRNIKLNPQEQRLREIAMRAGFLKPGANGAVISIPQAGEGHRVNARARAVILRHELSHGAYFTLPAYHDFVHHFYETVMTVGEQAAFQNFLLRQGYDPHEHGLIVNETLAYLIFTRDPQFFRPSAVGLPAATIAALQSKFVATMPDFWLTPMATEPLPNNKS